MKRIKHSKFKNTGILVELITRQITADVLDEKDNSMAVKIYRRYFAGSKPLAKELMLYKELIDNKFVSPDRAKELVEATLEARKELSNVKLRKEKYNLIKDIKENYEIDSFFSNKIHNYKELASVYQLFENATSIEGDLKPSDVVKYRHTLVEHITGKPQAQLEIEINELDKETEDTRLLAYNIMLEKFNRKYKDLDIHQKSLLREFIYNVSNTNSFRNYIDTEADRVREELNELIEKIEDPATKIKVIGVTKQVDKLKKGKNVKDEQILNLMRYYELVKEVRRVIPCPKKGVLQKAVTARLKKENLSG